MFAASALTIPTVPARSSRQSAVRHLSAWLGFGVARVVLPTLEECPDGAMVADVMIRLDWPTRLKLLVSGKGHIELLMWADATRQMRSVHAFAVLPPG